MARLMTVLGRTLQLAHERIPPERLQALRARLADEGKVGELIKLVGFEVMQKDLIGGRSLPYASQKDWRPINYHNVVENMSSEGMARLQEHIKTLYPLEAEPEQVDETWGVW